MDEVDKMRSSQLANTASPEIQERFKRAKKLLLKLNAMSGYEEECRSVLEELIPGIPASATICPPFCCDHGDGIRPRSAWSLRLSCFIRRIVRQRNGYFPGNGTSG